MAQSTKNPEKRSEIQVGIIMGSDSDLPVMQAAADILKEFNIGFELTVVSAHRTPLRMVEYAGSARDRGLKVIIAGAGGAAHLPGMIASITSLPVIGVPIKSSNSIDGWDSVLSILQMPNGIPVATVALNAAKNAGILAVSILGASNLVIGSLLDAYKKKLESEVLRKIEKLKKDGWVNNFD
jgi:5-(carboxyamino)imidazole ribonucleotide mutase